MYKTTEEHMTIPNGRITWRHVQLLQATELLCYYVIIHKLTELRGGATYHSVVNCDTVRARFQEITQQEFSVNRKKSGLRDEIQIAALF